MIRRNITSAMFYYHEGAFFSAENVRGRVLKWEEKSLRIDNDESIRKKFSREIKRSTDIDIAPDLLELVEPRYIEYEIRPLFFYCSDDKCGWNIRFKDMDEMKDYIVKKGKLKCERCGKMLVQSGHVFACKCSNISDIKEKYCKYHKSEKMGFIKPSIYDVSKWKFRCRKCGYEEPLQMFCSSCRNRMSLKSTEGSGLTTPLSFTAPSFDEPNYSWITNYLDIDISNDLEKLKEVEKYLTNVKSEYLKNRVKGVMEEKFKDNYEYVFERLADYASIYSNTIREDAKDFRNLGLRFSRVDGINLIKGVYGYVVNSFRMEKGTTNVVFFIQDGKYRILSNKIEDTEGIIIEFDKDRILKWLKNNGVIDSIPQENINEWFIRNILLSEGKIREWIYTLIHTISHGLLVSIQVLSGVSVDSVSELLFPEIPAVLIYTNYTTSLGHLESLFINMLEDWIEKTKDTIRECVHDPFCYLEDHACSGCLMISEVVCSDFYLDRRYVFDIFENKKIRGYWDDL